MRRAGSAAEVCRVQAHASCRSTHLPRLWCAPDLSRMEILFHMEGTPVILVPVASLSFTKLICDEGRWRVRAGRGGIWQQPTCLCPVLLSAQHPPAPHLHPRT